jgi:hypothetical protein
MADREFTTGQPKTRLFIKDGLGVVHEVSDTYPLPTSSQSASATFVSVLAAAVAAALIAAAAITPLNVGISPTSLPLLTDSIPPDLAASFFGTLNGKTARVVTVLGKRTLGYNTITTLQDIANYLDATQDSINAVSTGTEYFIRSTNAADTSAGTGARTVRIVYLDSSGVQQITTATLNGTTGVSLGTGFSYFQWAEVASLGTSMVAAGDITISSVSGAPTIAQIVEKITAGGTRSFSGRYMVPTGFTAYLKNWHVDTVGGAAQDSRLQTKSFAEDAISTVFLSKGSIHIDGNTNLQVELNYLPIPALTEMKISTIPTATGAANKFNMNLNLLLIAN